MGISKKTRKYTIDKELIVEVLNWINDLLIKGK